MFDTFGSITTDATLNDDMQALAECLPVAVLAGVCGDDSLAFVRFTLPVTRLVSSLYSPPGCVLFIHPVRASRAVASSRLGCRLFHHISPLISPLPLHTHTRTTPLTDNVMLYGAQNCGGGRRGDRAARNIVVYVRGNQPTGGSTCPRLYAIHPCGYDRRRLARIRLHL